jgi:DNA-binding transcriptional LysR family regulator
MEPSRSYNFRLDWIVSFVAVAHEGGFSAAAKALFRSQPRVSTHVAELEGALRVKLFDRSLQPAALTAEGRALLPHAEEVLARLDLLAQMGAATGAAPHGQVRLGAYPSAAAFLFAPAVRRLARVHPHVSLVLREGESLSLGTLLTDGEIDLAIRPMLPLLSDDRLASAVLWREPLVAVVPRDAGLAEARSLSLAQLASLSLVTIGENAGGVRRQFETNYAFAQAGMHPTIAFQTNQPQTLVSLVRHGLGVGVTNALAMTTANLDGVVVLPLLDVPVQRQVALWWRQDQPTSAAVEAVRNLLVAMPPPQWPWVQDDRPPAPRRLSKVPGGSARAAKSG